MDNGYNDIDTNAPRFPAFTDKQTHTITITMAGNKATHYVNGLKIRDALATNQNTNITPRDAGGFAIVLNSTTVAVESVKITSAVTPTDPAPSDGGLSTTAKVLIPIACVLAAAGIAVAVWFIVKKRKKN